MQAAWLRHSCASNIKVVGVKKLKMRHDNEKFIQAPKEYKKAGLTSINFPPNSGDLNPIETVWAELRKDLVVKEFEDLKKSFLSQLSGKGWHSY